MSRCVPTMTGAVPALIATTHRAAVVLDRAGVESRPLWLASRHGEDRAGGDVRTF